tara:strand:- start:355 stop:546 length:192 start_codon:yes stop_codon:yes gene_type:complete
VHLDLLVQTVLRAQTALLVDLLDLKVLLDPLDLRVQMGWIPVPFKAFAPVPTLNARQVMQRLM